MVFSLPALLIGCQPDPYQLELDLHFPEGGADLVEGAVLKLVTTDADGNRTVLPLGTSGGSIQGVPALPEGTASLGLLAEDPGGDEGAVNLDRALAWGEVAFDGGLGEGEQASASLLVAPFGDVREIGAVAPNRRVLGSALAVTRDSRVFVFGGETPGRLSIDRSNAKIFTMSLDGGGTKLEDAGASLPLTVGMEPQGLGEVPREYRGRVGLTATPVEVDGTEHILVAGGYPSIDFQFAATDEFLLYDPVENTLKSEKMDTARGAHVAIPFTNGNVLLYGGFVSNAFPTPTFSIWDEKRGVERKTGPLTTGALHIAGAPLGDEVVVCGGDLGSAPPNQQVWEPQAGCVRIRANGEVRDFDPLPDPLSNLAMVALGDELLATGGFTEPAIDIIAGGSITEFGTAPGTNKAFLWTEAGGWKPVGGLKKRRCGHQMVPLADGSALVVGGDERCAGFLGDMVAPVKCTERYEPETESFTLLECGDAVSGIYPTVGVSQSGDIVVMAGMEFSMTASSVDGAAAIGVSTRGPAAD
jgi:hypothetical protein